jgi:hypothetical protein
VHNQYPIFTWTLQVEINRQVQHQHVNHRLFNIVSQIEKRIANRRTHAKPNLTKKIIPIARQKKLTNVCRFQGIQHFF